MTHAERAAALALAGLSTADNDARCACGRELTTRDVTHGRTECLDCMLARWGKRIDAMRAEEPSDDEVLEGLWAMQREDAAKRGRR